MKKPDRTEEVRIPRAQGSEKMARDAAARFAAELGFSGERIEDIKTAVNEACLNAVEHAGGASAGEILVRLKAEPDGALIEVINRGKVPALPDTNPDIRKKIGGKERPRGWGVYLMKKLADEVTFASKRGVTTVTLRFRR